MKQCSGTERVRMSNEKLKKIDPSKLSSKIDLVIDCEAQLHILWAESL